MPVTAKVLARRALRLMVNGVVGLAPQKVLRVLFETLETRLDLAESAGYHVYPRAYFSPLPLREEVDLTLLQYRRRLPGIKLDDARALAFMETLGRYPSELESVPYERVAGEAFWFGNGWFTDFDAASLYALLRHLKPLRYVELGCGFSSLISCRALSRNADEGSPCDAVYADPQPRLDIAERLSCGRLIMARVQDLPFDLFTNLEAGDVLFIDTSHVLKLQSDVVYALVTILPSLKPGVWIHVHDMFTPYDYPLEWVTNPLFSCNEQYAVEGLVSGGDRYSVELPLYLLWREHRAAMTKFFPRGRLRPQGFWLRRSQQL